MAAIEALNAVAALGYAAIAGELIDEGQPPLSEIEAADELITAAGWAVLAGYLVVGPITFIPWFARAYSNLPRLGILPLRFRPGQAVWSWFVPILGLIRPKQIADDIYRGSRPDAPANRGFRELAVSPLLHWWWGAFLTALVLGRIATGVVNGAADSPLATQAATIELLEQQRLGLLLSAGASALAVAAAALAITVVIRITRAQTTAIDGAL